MLATVELQTGEALAHLRHGLAGQATDRAVTEAYGARNGIEPFAVAAAADRCLAVLPLVPSGFFTALLCVETLELQPGAEAAGAPALLGIEGEHARIRLGEAGAAAGAGAACRVHDRHPAACGQHLHHALAVLQRLGELRAQIGLAASRDAEPCDRQLDRVLAEPVEPRPRLYGQPLAIDAQVTIALGCCPLGEVGVETLARDHERRQQVDGLAAELLEDADRDQVGRLRFDACVTVRAMLCAELHIKQAQEMVDLGERRHGALAPAATGALLDRDGRRDAADRVDLRPRSRLHELPRVGVQGLEVAPLALVEQDVEGERRFTRSGDSGDHGERIARDVDIDAAQIVLTRVAYGDVARHRRRGRCCRAYRHRRFSDLGHRPPVCLRGERPTVLEQCTSSVRSLDLLDLGRCADSDHLAARIAALRSEIDDPFGSADDIEVVLDHHQRMPSVEQLTESTEQPGDILEMQSGGGFIEQEELASRRLAGGFFGGRLCRIGEVARELQALCLAARQRGDWLPQPQVVETDIHERT